MTSMFVRCSAWFGSVRFGILAPEIFIRIGSTMSFSIQYDSNNKRNNDNEKQ